MWPKEHGTYGEVGFPLLAALVTGEPGAAAFALAIAALCAYLAHEPLLVLRGTRGERRKREQRGRALRWLLGWSAGAVLAAGAGRLWAGSSTRLAVLVPLALALVTLTFALRGAERSLAGELIAGAALVSASVPVAVAGGFAPGPALLVALLWLTSFGLMTLVVRGVARVRFDAGAALGLARMVLTLALLASLALLGLGLLPPWARLVLSPTGLAAAVLVLRPPSPKHMRRVGWSLIGTSLLTFAALLAALPTPT